MTTKLQDVANQAVLLAGVNPDNKTSTVTGTGVDLLAGDNRCFAIQHVGPVTGTSPTLDGKLQESDTLGSGYGDISGATFTQVTASNNLQVITFDRTKRYVRYVGTIAGTSPDFTVGVVIGEQKKQL
jgi:hypothetical protein